MIERATVGLALALAGGSACENDGPTKISAEQAMDAENCKDCHPQHYQEWLGSMHAYAAEDPVFRAMNELGQQRTNGELGDFCIQCHAPVAVELGLTEDGTNLDDVPAHLRGVTCYACHNVIDVQGKHNNPLKLAMDGLMRGGIRDPDVGLAAHDAEWSKWLAGSERETRLPSAQMCGSCHDIVTPAGVHLERTYAEWQASLYAELDDAGVLPSIFSQSCVDCHMGPPTQGAAADVDGVRGDRLLHQHNFAGVDLQLTQFPDAEQSPALRLQQLTAIEQGPRKRALCSALCVKAADGGGFDVKLWLHNEGAGHSWTSGATQDRRAWVELIAYEGDMPVLESGVVADGDPVAELDDPNLWLIRERMLDAMGKEVHMFWEARSLEGQLLEVAPELTPGGDAATWQSRDFHVEADAIDRVTARVRLRPIGLEVIDELIAAGVLDPSIRDEFQTHDLPTSVLDWNQQASDAFCGASNIDCGDYGACIAHRADDAIALACRPPELRAD